MYNISVCESCGRTIEAKFLYCPWCGFSKVVHKKEVASLDQMFSKYEESKKEERKAQLLQLEAELTKLEEELSVLALSAEMHK